MTNFKRNDKVEFLYGRYTYTGTVIAIGGDVDPWVSSTNESNGIVKDGGIIIRPDSRMDHGRYKESNTHYHNPRYGNIKLIIRYQFDGLDEELFTL